MKALVWHGTNDVRVEQVPDPRILNPRDAIVKVTSTAICGSDLHLLDGFIPTMRSGDILGHEFMGEVVEVGAAVKNLKPGDRVVVPFPIACGHCGACDENGSITPSLPSASWNGLRKLRQCGLCALNGSIRSSCGSVRRGSRPSKCV